MAVIDKIVEYGSICFLHFAGRLPQYCHRKRTGTYINHKRSNAYKNPPTDPERRYISGFLLGTVDENPSAIFSPPEGANVSSSQGFELRL